MAFKKIEPIEKICPICGKTFLVGGRGRPPKDQIYDSLKCKALARIIQPKINQLDQLTAAYIAGLFDGEGSIILWDRGYGGRKQLRCTISNTYEPTMNWLKEITGSGTIIRHVFPTETGYKDSLTWQIYGQNAVSLLKQMMPFLQIKKQRAEEAIDSQIVKFEVTHPPLLTVN